MKVKIKGRVYDANREPIMLILDDEDKENIENMAAGATKYCAYPDARRFTVEKIKAFMVVEDNNEANRRPTVTE